MSLKASPATTARAPAAVASASAAPTAAAQRLVPQARSTLKPITDVSGELRDILHDAAEAQRAQLEGSDEPLVAACRSFIQVKGKGKATITVTANEALRVFLADRTIRGVVYRQGMRYRLGEEDCEDLLQDLGLMFHSKLLPTLRDAEKIWSVAAITARRLAAGKANRAREVPLEDMVSARFDSAGHFTTTEGATSRVTDLLHEAAGQVAIPHEDVDRRLDQEAAIKKFNRLVSALGSDPMKAVYAYDGMPVGQARDPNELKNGAPSVNAGAAAMIRMGLEGVFQPNGVTAPADSVRVKIKRVPLSYGQRLAKIRLELGMSVRNFAAALNTSEPSMAQFLTCAAATPEQVWEDAQLLMAQGAPEHDALVRRFGGKPMQEIVTSWMVILSKRLGRAATQADLSRAIGVYKSTISRWTIKAQKPELKQIAEYEKMLNGLTPAVGSSNKHSRQKKTTGS
jgi:transcriptional regulator with XRE-family HTH domain